LEQRVRSINPITVLRDKVPLRPLTFGEAQRIAEMQATIFLKQMGVKGPAVPGRIISELPKLRVNRLSPFPTSGASQWYRGQWLVVLNGSEPTTRQRFSLAHEFKHIIDHRFIDLIYNRFPERDRAAMIEQLCDYFAGCLLMPRPWVKHYYCAGVQHLPELAELFGVSQAAMTVRLNQLGLVEPAPRCIPVDKELIEKAFDRTGKSVNYFRSATSLVT
jgi:Zn-dependent peptidase ImmA (M78 family)